MVVSDAALLAQVGEPGRRATSARQGADAPDVVVGAVSDEDDLRLIQLVGHFVAVFPSDHADGFPAEHVHDGVVPVDGVAVGCDVLRGVDVTEVTVPLRDYGGRPVKRTVLAAIDDFPDLALVDAEWPDQQTVAAERCAHEMSMQLGATVDQAGAPGDGEVPVGEGSASLGEGGRSRRVGAAGRGRAGGDRTGDGRRQRDGGSRHSARDVAARVAGVELGLALQAAHDDEGGDDGEDREDREAEVLDVHF